MKITMLMTWHCDECGDWIKVSDDISLNQTPPKCCVIGAISGPHPAYECGECGELFDDWSDHGCILDAIVPKCGICGRRGQDLVTGYGDSYGNESWCTMCHERLEAVWPSELDDMCIGESIEIPGCLGADT